MEGPGIWHAQALKKVHCHFQIFWFQLFLRPDCHNGPFLGCVWLCPHIPHPPAGSQGMQRSCPCGGRVFLLSGPFGLGFLNFCVVIACGQPLCAACTRADTVRPPVMERKGSVWGINVMSRGKQRCSRSCNSIPQPAVLAAGSNCGPG